MPSLFNFSLLATLIELAGGLVIVGYVLYALALLFRSRSIEQARLVVADGALAGLSFKVAATLLKTMELHTWEQLFLFSITLAIRTLLKMLFTWEKARLESGKDLLPRN